MISLMSKSGRLPEYQMPEIGIHLKARLFSNLYLNGKSYVIGQTIQILVEYRAQYLVL